MSASDQPADERTSAGGDYEYDEAHDLFARGARRDDPTPRQVTAPPGSADVGGDYGYDEAHDFRAR